jgi:uncharacterized membrane protein YtjA (UPF0391 family)
MAYWSAAFLLIALVAGVMGAGGIAGLSWLAASGLFLAALLLALFPVVLRLRQATPRRRAERRPGF